MNSGNALVIRLLRFVPLLMLSVLVAIFAALAEGFLNFRNLANIVVQASSLAILASGMTFVLITAGIDLSIGSVMFLSAAIAGKMVVAGHPLYAAMLAALAIGIGCGLINGLFIIRFGIPPFIVTLAFLYAWRGLALYITETRAMNLPDDLLQLFTSSLAGIPTPIWILALGTVIGEVSLSRTGWGRQLYAAGQSRSQALLAGIPVSRRLYVVYTISGFAAALAGLVSVAQLGAVSPTFGFQREFAAIAAAVLGGASLFGGRGRVLPGAVLGAVLIQTVESGLVFLNTDPYLYPIVMALIIFVAVLLDSVRSRYIQSLGRRKIRAAAAP